MKTLLRDLKQDWEKACQEYHVPARASGYFFPPRLWFRVARFVPRFLTTLTARCWFAARYGEGEYWEYSEEKRDE